MIVDSHVHILRSAIEERIPKKTRSAFQLLKSKAQSAVQPFAHAMHRTQPIARHLPGPVQKKLDQLGALWAFPNALIEGTVTDLLNQMKKYKITYSVVIAQPPHTTNEYVLSTCKKNHQLIPVVNIPPSVKDGPTRLKKYVSQGAKALKIHPAWDGHPTQDPHYLSLLKAAERMSLPVIVHTGCIENKLLFKSPDEAKVEKFIPWFQSFSQIPFILAHMNINHPHIVFDLMDEFPNLYTDTSWQPTEIIGEATRRVGANRILFGSDWPILGANISIHLKRLMKCLENKTIKPDELEAILYKNAFQLFKIPENECQ